MLDVYLIISFEVVIICLFLLKIRQTTLEQKLVGALILVSFPFELYAGYIQSFKQNNLFIYHILTPIQYTFYAFIYYFAVHAESVKKIILFSVPVVILAGLALGFTIQPVTSYNSYTIILSNLFTIVWIFTYYRETFVQLKIIRLEREPLFWISTGLLFYSLGGFFVEGLMNYLIEQSPQLAPKFYYRITVVLVCFLHVMFIISFLCSSLFKSRAQNP